MNLAAQTEIDELREHRCRAVNRYRNQAIHPLTWIGAAALWVAIVAALALAIHHFMP